MTVAQVASRSEARRRKPVWPGILWRCTFAVYCSVSIASDVAGTGRPPSCAALARAQNWDRARIVCSESYQRTNRVSAGIAAARSLFWSGRVEEAEALAQALTMSERASDAFLLLGDV